MAGLLRRLRRPKDAPAPDDEPGAEEPVDDASPTVPSSPEPGEPAGDAPADRAAGAAPGASPSAPPAAPAVARTPAPAEPAPAVPLPSGPPPPLPREPEGGASPRLPGGPRAFRSCFLCGTAMDGPWCPKCRMVWND